MEIIVDDAVIDMIKKEGRDYRICTACMGPALVPTSVKPPKDSDIKIEIGASAPDALITKIIGALRNA